MMSTNDPLTHPSLVMTPDHDIWGISRYRNYGWFNNGNPASDAQQNTSLMEQSIHALRQKLLQNQLPPKSYVAIVKTSPMMEIGTPSAHEEASFHIILGRW